MSTAAAHTLHAFAHVHVHMHAMNALAETRACMYVVCAAGPQQGLPRLRLHIHIIRHDALDGKKGEGQGASLRRMQTDRQTDRQTDMHAYMHTCVHTCIQTYRHTCIHAYIRRSRSGASLRCSSVTRSVRERSCPGAAWGRRRRTAWEVSK